MLSAFVLACSASAQAPTPMTVGAVPLSTLGTRGAAVPFAEYEAENAHYDGVLIGPSRRLSDIAAEASGRRAVRLESPGRFVEFTLAKPANALTVRYAIPDSGDGKGRQSTLAVAVGRERIASLQLTSRYGWFYGAYPFSNRPSDGGAHHFFDEARILLPRTLPAGTRVRLEPGQADRAPWYVIDLADFEEVGPPRSRPASAIDVERMGADPTGVRESSRSFRMAIEAARRSGRPVWIGRGTFRIDSHIGVDRVTITGAGPWYSVLRGRGVGLYGNKAQHGSVAVHLSDFAIIGEVRERVDRAQLAGIGGTIGGGSSIRNLWLQHHKTGIWLDGPLDGLDIDHVRIVDNSADGINLADGAANVRITNAFVRNSGDDGIALWSRGSPDRDVTISHDTVIAPVLANGIAAYGGHDIVVSDNFVADSLTEGGAIQVANRFRAVPLSGRIEISRNLLVRAGSYDLHWRFGIGALWVYALDEPIDADIEAGDNDIDDSTIAAVQFLGKPIRKVSVTNLIVAGADRWLQVQSGGDASFADVRARDLQAEGYADCDSAFRASFAGMDPALASSNDRLCGPLDARVLERRLSH